MKRKILLVPLLPSLLLTCHCLAFAWSGKDFGVADGDTIAVLRNKKEVRIRLYGIDAPERGQAFSKMAKQFSYKMCCGKAVATDRYATTGAMIYADKTLLNEELVKAGLAWVYWKYCITPFASLGRISRWEPGWTSVDYGQTLTA